MQPSQEQGSLMIHWVPSARFSPPQVLQYALGEGLIAVRGNHDDAALAAYHDWRRGDPKGRHITKAAKLGW